MITTGSTLLIQRCLEPLSRWNRLPFPLMKPALARSLLALSSLLALADGAEPIKIRSAKANSSMAKYPAANAIDGKVSDTKDTTSGNELFDGIAKIVNRHTSEPEAGSKKRPR